MTLYISVLPLMGFANSLIIIIIEVSVIDLPPSTTNRKHWWNSLNLQAVHDSPIATYSERLLNVNIGLQWTFQWIFIVSDVKQPILGAGFLRHCNLLVDIVHNCVTDALTQLQVQGITYHHRHLPSPTLFSSCLRTNLKHCYFILNFQT